MQGENSMKRKTIIIALLPVILLTFGYCKKAVRGGLTDNYGYASSTASYQESGFVLGYEEPAGVEGQADRLQSKSRQGSDGDSISADLSNVERKLVKRADIVIKVENLAKADVSVTELMKKYDAYAAITNNHEASNHYSLRVPSKAYDIFLTEMNGMGRLIRRSEYTDDVTLRYYDLEGRLETKRELLRTFQSYLRRASNIEEILAVESRISELQYDIEGTGKQLRDLANRIDYATIDLALLGPAAASDRSETFGERIGQMFGSFGGFLSGVAVVIIGIVIYGVPILLLLAVFFWLFFGKIGLMRKLWLVVKSKK
jgi:hypothetical protein